MRIAVISDVHGNALALEAVLADIARHSPDAVLNLGDHLVGPLDPERTAGLLAGLDAVSIRGNTDRYIIEADIQDLPSDERWIVESIPAPTMDWLRALPATAQFEDQIFLSHGAPGGDEIYWLDRPQGNFFRTATQDEILAELPAENFPLYCCGHTHVARIVTLPDGRIVFNPGSVGRPSFNMGDPESAARAAPDAAYALVRRTGGQWSIDLRQIQYDHETAAAQARRNGNRVWEQDLLTGRRR